MATPATVTNTSNKAMSPVVKPIEKLKGNMSSDSKIRDHLLEKGGRTKLATSKNIVNETGINLKNKEYYLLLQHLHLLNKFYNPIAINEFA